MKFVKGMIVALLVAGAYFAGRGGISFPERTASSKPAERKPLYWVDPMHPSYKSDKPGLAPDCGMKLEPVYADSNRQSGGTLQISAERQQMIGVRYGTVEMREGSETIRAPGKVAFDERRVTNVNSRVDGWIEKVFVDFTGAPVKAGQPLVTVYSPEMLATQQEFLLATKGQDMMRHSPIAETHGQTQALVDAARRRLELFDFSPAQMEELISTGKPTRTFTVYAPANGVVTERNAFPNQRVTPEMSLYKLTDLSRVWVLADIFEHDAPSIHQNQRALIHAGNRTISGRVEFVMPQVEGETRTLKVRLEAENSRMDLRPDMFVEVEFPIALPRRLSVPADAVLDSGLRQTVFVDLGDGKLEPREVKTGARFDGNIEILSGLKAGERIVTSGNFLIDSESQLKAATSGMGASQ